MRAVIGDLLTLTNVITSALTCSSFFISSARADAQHRVEIDASHAVNLAFARLTKEQTYRIETKGSSGGAAIDSRIDVQLPDKFHILNRAPNPSELILTSDGSFAKTDAKSPWRAVPMSYRSIAESMGPKATEKLLKTMREVVFKGVANCAGPGRLAMDAKQYQFLTESETNAVMRTTITIANDSGLPCRIRAQQSEAGIDTTATYDYTRSIRIRSPK